MTTSQTSHERLVRQLMEEEISLGDFSLTEQLIAPDFVDHTNPPGMQHGIAGHQAIVSLFRRAFPDSRWTIDELIATEDRVIIRTTLTGTHQGEFFGIPPTGAGVRVGGIHILRVDGGRVVEHWGFNDDLSMMRQLGVVA